MGDRLIAEWEGVGVLSVPLGRPAEGAELSMAPGIDPVFATKWQRGTVASLLRHLQGKTSLHGSAIVLGGRAIVFLGESGAGKSTCSADLCRRLSAPLLADDAVNIDVEGGALVVSPTEVAHWLLPDSAEALGHAPVGSWKTTVDPWVTASAPAPLGAIVQLAFGAPGSEPSLTPQKGVAAFVAVNSSFVRFLFDEPAVEARDLDAIADIVEAAPVVRLTRPKAWSALPRCAELISALARRLAAEGA